MFLAIISYNSYSWNEWNIRHILNEYNNECYNSGIETFLNRKQRTLAIILIFMLFLKNI